MGIILGQPVQHLLGPCRGQIFGIGIGLVTGWQDCETGNIGMNDAAFDRQLRIGERVHQALAAFQAKAGQDAGLGKVSVDQQHFIVFFRGDRKGKVQGTECLAFIGMRRTYQYPFAMPHRRDFLTTLGSQQQLTLDDPEFFRDAGYRSARNDEPGFPELVPIDNHTRAVINFNRSWRDRSDVPRCIVRWRAFSGEPLLVAGADGRDIIIDLPCPLEQRSRFSRRIILVHNCSLRRPCRAG